MNGYPLTMYASTPSHSPFESIADACVLYAKLSSTLCGFITCACPLTPTVTNVIETTYFLLIFLVHFLVIQLTNHNSRPLQSLVISTLTCWLEVAVIFLSVETRHQGLAWMLSICALARARCIQVDGNDLPQESLEARDNLHRGTSDL